MLFYKNGPDIPDELIAARDNGRVVFFCGAGISVPAGLPSFLTLTRNVMRKLGVPTQPNGVVTTHRNAVEHACSPDCDKEYKLPFSLDQTFYLLQQEYGVETVEKEVNDAIKTNTKSLTSNHQTILRLAKNQNQQPQIVTTNFDLLFEHANKSIRTHIPPSLPDLSSGQMLEGLVYLHGRWSKTARPEGSAHSTIISSADFGRAYLADGWASRFIKQLAKQYVIVLLGYSAEDPPVRYLLEGLHTRSGKSNALIYAFDRGTQENVNQNWRHRGVNGIAFSEFSDLWGSLEAWADYADNPSTWHATTLNLAKKNPKDLNDFQRRQVTNLVSSDHGAKLFSECAPPPCAEWLCVFDPHIRNAKSETVRVFSNNEKDFEYIPREIYGLDNDPDPEVDDTQQKKYFGVDFLSTLPNEYVSHINPGFAQPNTSASRQPMRLIHLGSWFCKLLSDPLSLWWAAGWNQLHPQLVISIQSHLNNEATHMCHQHLGSHHRRPFTW